jgi:Holliday junction resolvasome RuvABC endonuclease subunit
MGQLPLISAFDLSGYVGIATGIAGSRPRLQTWPLKGDDRPARLVELDNLLEQHFDRFAIDLVGYEQPLSVNVLLKIGAREETIAFLRGAVAILEQRACRAGIKITSWPIQRARQAVIGQGRFRKGEAKRGVMAGCKLLGYSPADDHQADALVGHLYLSALANPRWAILQTPLFKRTA